MHASISLVHLLYLILSLILRGRWKKKEIVYTETVNSQLNVPHSGSTFNNLSK